MPAAQKKAMTASALDIDLHMQIKTVTAIYAVTGACLDLHAEPGYMSQ